MAYNNISRASRLMGYLHHAGAYRHSVGNPKSDGIELFDPRLDQVRSMQQAIYESYMLKEFGDGAEFRDGSGERLEARTGLFLEPQMSSLVSKFMFAPGTSVSQRRGYLEPGTRDVPTTKSVSRSYERREDPDHHFLNRQTYEETIGLARKSGFYRTTMEPTRKGNRYFVWPLPPGAFVPKAYASEQAANADRDRLNRQADPRQTGLFWQLPDEMYTKSDLADWLAPDSAYYDGPFRG